MLSNSFKSYTLNTKAEINFLLLIVFIFIFRTAVPFFKYPFIILYGVYLLYFAKTHLLKIKRSLKGVFVNYMWIIILFAVLFLSFIFSSKLYLVIFKDIINVVVIFSILVLYGMIITTKDQLKLFLNSIVRLSILFAIIISIMNFFGDKFSFIYSNNDNYWVDKNFATIPIFFGFICVLFRFPKRSSSFDKIILNLLLLLFTMDLALSGSRRALLILLLIIVIMLIMVVLSYLNKNDLFVEIKNRSEVYFILLFILSSISYLLIFSSSVKFKNSALRTLGHEDLNASKKHISDKLINAYSIINRNINYSDFYNKIWPLEFDSKDPDSGWGTRKHKTVFFLEGKNVEIIPEGTKGYLMDSTCNATSWRGDAYSYTSIGRDSVELGDLVKASVYCFVSKEFNGNWVRIASEGNTYGNNKSDYDLNKKGTWQNLTIRANCKNGIAPVYLYFSKFGVKTFKSLKGYVIFAYPTYEIIPATGLNNNCSSLSIKNSVKKLKKPRASKILLKSSVYGLGVLPLLINQFENDTDPIRKWIANIISEDTTYYGFDTNIITNRLDDNFVAPRIIRWQFAWQLFLKEYNWRKKIFGNGFDYLNWYGYYFYNDKTRSDWPHNPFLSVLLYSGIIGLGLYLYLMYRVIRIYLKYIKQFYILFIFFCITFFFSFFSAGNPFDPPVMGFFMMLPFFIDYIHKKDKSD